MKRYLVIISLMLLFLFAADAALGQQSCEFNIVGAWKMTGPVEKNPTVYRFDADGKVTVSAAGPGQAAHGRLVGSGTYKLDNPDAPTSIVFRGAMFGKAPSSMKIITYNDVSFTARKPGGAERTRSSGPPERPTGMRSSAYALSTPARPSSPSPSTPGETTFTVMPERASSSASAFENATTAALAAE